MFELAVFYAFAAILVVGSYYAARKLGGGVMPVSEEPVREAKAEADIALPRELEAVR